MQYTLKTRYADTAQDGIYEIFRGNERVTTAVTTHCFLNAAFKPIPIPKEPPLST